MLIRNPPALREWDVTDPMLYASRRTVLAGIGLAGMGMATAALGGIGRARAGTLALKPGAPVPQEPATALDKIASYNNYYEFGTDKSDPAATASQLQTSPWSVTVDGECHKPATSRSRTW